VGTIDRTNRISEAPGQTRKAIGWCAGGAAVAAATAAAAALPSPHQPVRLLLVAVAVGCCAAALIDVPVTLALAGLAYLSATAFLGDEDAATSVIGAEGLWNLVVLGLATGLGVGQRWIRAVQADADLDAELRDLIDDVETDADRTGRTR
jgi:hypothetical protein